MFFKKNASERVFDRVIGKILDGCFIVHSVIFWFEISSQFGTPKITKMVSFLLRYSKNRRALLVFMKHGVRVVVDISSCM